MRSVWICTAILFLAACTGPQTNPSVVTVVLSAAAATAAPVLTRTKAFTPTITPTATAPAFAHRFHVEGNAFVDEQGRPKIFRGLSAPDIVQMAMRNNPNLSTLDAHYFQVMAEWGAEIVRLPVTPYSLHTFGFEKFLQTLDQAIAWAGESGLYAIVDFHSVGWIPDNWYPPPANDTTLAEFLQFWDVVSRRYAGNDIVAFYELFNEPAREVWPYTAADWKSWKEVAEQGVDAVRAHDPDKTILVGGVQSSYNLSFVAADPVADGNVGYATHPYPRQNYPDWDAAFGNLSARYPVIVTEFGYDEAGNWDLDIGGVLYHLAIIDYLERHHMSQEKGDI